MFYYRDSTSCWGDWTKRVGTAERVWETERVETTSRESMGLEESVSPRNVTKPRMPGEPLSREQGVGLYCKPMLSKPRAEQ